MNVFALISFFITELRKCFSNSLYSSYTVVKSLNIFVKKPPRVINLSQKDSFAFLWDIFFLKSMHVGNKIIFSTQYDISEISLFCMATAMALGFAYIFTLVLFGPVLYLASIIEGKRKRTRNSSQVSCERSYCLIFFFYRVFRLWIYDMVFFVIWFFI